MACTENESKTHGQGDLKSEQVWGWNWWSKSHCIMGWEVWGSGDWNLNRSLVGGGGEGSSIPWCNESTFSSMDRLIWLKTVHFHRYNKTACIAQHIKFKCALWYLLVRIRFRVRLRTLPATRICCNHGNRWQSARLSSLVTMKRVSSARKWSFTFSRIRITGCGLSFLSSFR